MKIFHYYYIVAGYKTYLEDGRYTWRLNSAQNFLFHNLQHLSNTILYADLPAHFTPSIKAGDSMRPELKVGFEKNLNVNSSRKEDIF